MEILSARSPQMACGISIVNFIDFFFILEGETVVS